MDKMNGHKNQIIDTKFKNLYDEGIYIYEENEIIQNVESVF